MIEKLKKRFSADILDLKQPRAKRVYMRVNPDKFREIFACAVNELGFVHLITITGVDLKNEFELLYHLFGNGIALSIAYKVNREKPKIETVTDIIPGAVLYERELIEMFGIEVNNIPDDRSVILPDVWPKGQYPLRKDWNKDMLPESFNEGLRRNWKE